jgi:hypothetical protein
MAKRSSASCLKQLWLGLCLLEPELCFSTTLSYLSLVGNLANGSGKAVYGPIRSLCRANVASTMSPWYFLTWPWSSCGEVCLLPLPGEWVACDQWNLVEETSKLQSPEAEGLCTCPFAAWGGMMDAERACTSYHPARRSTTQVTQIIDS